jgi:hypothetical protein
MSAYDYIQTGIVLISFTASLTTYFRPVAVLALRMFAYFLLGTLIVEFIGYYLVRKNHSNTDLYNFWGIVEFSFYFWFLRMTIQHSIAKKIIFQIMLFYPLLSLINIFFIQGVGNFATITYSTGCLLIVVITVFYFFEQFQFSRGVTLYREPAFWICFGLLLYYCCSFPIFGLANFLTKAHWFKSRILGILLDLVNILLYSLFTIAFLCRLKMRKSIS